MVLADASDRIANTLRDRLTAGDDAEVLRVVLTLRASEGSTLAARPTSNTRGDRTAWRTELINQQAQRLRTLTELPRRQFHALGLVVRGGTTSRTMVIEGPIRALRVALALPEVEHATLDEAIAIDLGGTAASRSTPP